MCSLHRAARVAHHTLTAHRPSRVRAVPAAEGGRAAEPRAQRHHRPRLQIERKTAERKKERLAPAPGGGTCTRTQACRHAHREHGARLHATIGSCFVSQRLPLSAQIPWATFFKCDTRARPAVPAAAAAAALCQHLAGPAVVMRPTHAGHVTSVSRLHSARWLLLARAPLTHAWQRA